jgi:predicted DCC family thiol-disulfide oxidoreductase YuxK
MENLELNLQGRTLVLYDGYCALCNGVVRFLIHRDSQDHLRFAPADRTDFQPLLTRHNLISPANPTQPETILALINPGTPHEALLTHSTAFLHLLNQLPRPWPFVSRTLRLIPRPIRDFFYRLIARNRFRIHKRLTTCPIPTESERRHFL